MFLSIHYSGSGIIYLVYLNYRLTALLLIMLPLITLIINKFNIKIRRVSKKAQIKIADISNVLQETISAVRVVKSFGRKNMSTIDSGKRMKNFRAKVNAQYEAVISPVVEFLAAIALPLYSGMDLMFIMEEMAPAALITFYGTSGYITAADFIDKIKQYSPAGSGCC